MEYSCSCFGDGAHSPMETNVQNSTQGRKDDLGVGLERLECERHLRVSESQERVRTKGHILREDLRGTLHVGRLNCELQGQGASVVRVR